MSTRRKIKVLECIRQGQIGGGESHLLSLVENMDRSLFEPVVLAFTDGPLMDRLKQLGIENHVIYTEKPFDISKWRMIKNFLKQHQIDIVHAHGTRANSNIVWAAKSLGLPVIYTVHGWSFHPDQKPLVRYLRIMGEKYLTSRSDINISVSSSNQQSGKEYIKSFDSVVINNGIDQKKFDPQKNHKDIRAEFGIAPDTVLVLFIARFTGHKQPLTLINAFAKALPAHSNMHLLMVGDGDQKAEAVQLIDKLGLQEKITLEPFRLDVPDVLAAADIFVLPSLWEGLPIGLLEAMAMGKAVIATNVDGTKEVVKNNSNGLLIEAGNIAALTDALVVLGKNKMLRQKFQGKALETVQQQFNAVHMTRKIENIYTSLLERTGYFVPGFN